MDAHNFEDSETISAELVACTLGQRRRPELRADAIGAMVRITRTINATLLDAFRAFTRT